MIRLLLAVYPSPSPSPSRSPSPFGDATAGALRAIIIGAVIFLFVAAIASMLRKRDE